MIGGNTKATFQLRTSTTKNEIGEVIREWEEVRSLKGLLDYVSGDAKYNVFNAKVQESSHVFICDYKPIPEVILYEGKEVRVTDENTKIVANSKEYLVKLIDDPMDLHDHLEIYADYTGG